MSPRTGQVQHVGWKSRLQGSVGGPAFLSGSFAADEMQDAFSRPAPSRSGHTEGSDQDTAELFGELSSFER